MSARGQLVKLLVYEYGLRISKAQDLDDSLNDCVRPVATDRAGVLKASFMS